jgi:Amino acid permease
MLPPQEEKETPKVLPQKSGDVCILVDLKNGRLGMTRRRSGGPAVQPVTRVDVGGNAGIQYALPASATAQAAVLAAAASDVALGREAISLVSIGMLISMLAILNGTVMSGGRVPFAVARDGYFFKAMGEVRPRFHTPALALAIQGAVAVLLIVVGGAFRQLFWLAAKGELSVGFDTMPILRCHVQPGSPSSAVRSRLRRQGTYLPCGRMTSNGSTYTPPPSCRYEISLCCSRFSRGTLSEVI